MIWLPPYRQIAVGAKNPNYFHSLFLGLVAAPFNFCYIILDILVLPILRTVLAFIAATFFVFIVLPVTGIFGILTSITREQADKGGNRNIDVGSR